MNYVAFKGIYKQYDNIDNYAVTDFNLEIQKGEFIVFVGPSGCGKSTTLRMLAGLETISKGELWLDGVCVNNVPPKERNIAMVFQNYALYPHMTVADNISFGLKITKMSNEEIEKKVKWAAEILGLGDYLKRKPKDLSGGQRQRVALGRAIVRNPKVFLMDEPLSNLDAKLRVSMRNEITKLHRELKATTVYVTHDQIEAMTMADRIVVLKDGMIQQVGSPIDLYNKPNNLFVASFIGTPQMNFFNVTLNNNQLLFEDDSHIIITDGIMQLIGDNTNLILGIRPEHITVDKIMLDAFANQIMTKTIVNLERMGHENHVSVLVDTNEVILKVPNQMSEDLGDQLSFMIDINKCHFFDSKTELRIC